MQALKQSLGKLLSSSAADAEQLELSSSDSDSSLASNRSGAKRKRDQRADTKLGTTPDDTEPRAKKHKAADTAAVAATESKRDGVAEKAAQVYSKMLQDVGGKALSQGRSRKGRSRGSGAGAGSGSGSGGRSGADSKRSTKPKKSNLEKFKPDLSRIQSDPERKIDNTVAAQLYLCMQQLASVKDERTFSDAKRANAIWVTPTNDSVRYNLQKRLTKENFDQEYKMYVRAEVEGAIESVWSEIQALGNRWLVRLPRYSVMIKEPNLSTNFMEWVKPRLSQRLDPRLLASVSTLAIQTTNSTEIYYRNWFNDARLIRDPKRPGAPPFYVSGKEAAAYESESDEEGG